MKKMIDKAAHVESVDSDEERSWAKECEGDEIDGPVDDSVWVLSEI